MDNSPHPSPMPTLNGWSSQALHGGHRPDPMHAHQIPIYASSTFVFDTAEQGARRFSGEDTGYIYSRLGNPTFTEAENRIAALEGFQLDVQPTGILHASGMGAITTLLLSALRSGDRILTHYSLYGGTNQMLNEVLPRLGIEAIIADLRDPNRAEALFQQHPGIRLLYLETPANPTLQCVDIEALTRIAHRFGCLVACDNTFSTPYLQQPFRFGVDFVIHSTTKFLNGHGTAIGGILLGRDQEFMKGPCTQTHRLLGANGNPFDAFLLIQGLKTLELRMERHCRNAMQVAQFLNEHPAVARVNYTGLQDHPDHLTALKQMRHPGAMMSVELKGGWQAGVGMMNRLRMCVRTVSLGTCDTLICHPASMTHLKVPRAERERYGITDGLLRMSVGIENIEDILTDLNQALGSSV